MRAVRSAPGGVRLDGRLDDAVWQRVVFAADFLQKEPVEGGAPSERTEIAIVYDDDALYVGARMFASDPTAIVRTLSRRDADGNAERLIVALDTYHDRRTAYSFGVTAAGVRSDGYHPRDVEWDVDLTYDPVWQAAARIDSAGWTAEMRIPLSQLRFNNADGQVWGINVHRFIPTTNEDIYWVYVPRDETGWASRFGTLVGLDAVRPKRRLEVMPYLASDATVTSGTLVDPENPFDDGRTMSARAGADLKVGIGSNLTLDATVNPDFGQVDADPAEVNLSAFETFFEERRPFFTEGSQLFQGNGPGYFYSRRIGRAPRGTAQGDYVDAPAQTTILGAAKLTGRLPRGLSIGALAAVTDDEHARVFDAAGGATRRERVEPLTGYGALRLQQELGASNSTVGAAVTATRRDLASGDPLAAMLLTEAYAGGVDWNLRFRGGDYELAGYVGGSAVRGTPDAVAGLQRSSAHYFERPDQTHVTFDSTRTTLTGATAALGFVKNAGTWLWDTQVTATSPGFDINDVGRLRRADDVTARGSFWYRETTPGVAFRNWEAGVWTWNAFNFGGIHRDTRIGTWAFGTFRNYVSGWVNVTVGTNTLDDEMTRGGPLVKIGGFWSANAGASGNPNTSVTWRSRLSVFNNPRSDWEGWNASVGTTARPAGRWSVTADLNVTRSIQGRQFVTALDGGPAETFGTRYVLSRVAVRNLSLQLRANYSFSPDLTLELYAEPFAASRRFFGFGEVPAPRALRLREYGTDGTLLTREADGTYTVIDGTARFSLGNPDFTSLSFRSNLVLRWEWRPGSTLFLVWQQNRSAFDETVEGIHPGRLISTFRSPGRNFFSVKMSYWIG